MIDKISYRQLQRLSMGGVCQLLDINGGIVIVTVDSQPEFTIGFEPQAHLPNRPDGRYDPSLTVKLCPT